MVWAEVLEGGDLAEVAADIWVVFCLRTVLVVLVRLLSVKLVLFLLEFLVFLGVVFSTVMNWSVLLISVTFGCRAVLGFCLRAVGWSVVTGISLGQLIGWSVCLCMFGELYEVRGCGRFGVCLACAVMVLEVVMGS